MRTFREWIVRLGGLFNKQCKDRELDDEIESHLQMHIEDNLRLGMTPEEARREAMIKLGGIESTKEAYRDQRGLPFLDTLLHDLRYGARKLGKRPGFTLIVVSTLALGIGTNTMLFTLVNTILFGPLQFRNPDQLVSITETTERGNRPMVPGKFVSLKQKTRSFGNMAASLRWGFPLVRSEGAEMLFGFRVSAGLFDVLKAKPGFGRTFLPGEDQPGANHVVVLSYALWQRISGDTNLIGQTIILGNDSFTVIGIMPPEFWFGSRNTGVFVPFQFSAEELRNPRGARIQVMGRLKPGTTLRQAQAELASLALPLEEEFPSGNNQPGMQAVSYRESIRPDFLRILMALQGAAVFVLLIACANIANLLLVRASTRSKEFAIRTALGAGRGRIVRQLLTESMLLALVGGILGVLLAYASLDFIYAALPDGLRLRLPLSDLQKLHINGGVLWFALGTSILTGLVFGLVPAFSTARKDLNASLKDSGRSSGVTAGGQRFSRVMVVGEMALSMVLLIGAGLMLKSLVGVLHTKTGFDSEHVLQVGFELSRERYSQPNQRIVMLGGLTERVRAMPGVVTAALVDQPFVVGNPNASGSIFQIDGQPEPPAGGEPRAEIYAVDTDYFRTVRISLLRGRQIADSDTSDTPPVVVISESVAKRYWPHDDPIGKLIRLGAVQTNTQAAMVVGIVSDVRHPLAATVQPTIYRAFKQSPGFGGFVVARTSVEPMNLAAAIQKEVRALDRTRPDLGAATHEKILADRIAYPRFSTFLLSCFAGLALLLATLGIYGVMHYWVVQRTQEMGIRMALGAQKRDVITLVLSAGGKLAFLGIGIGLIAGLWLSRLISTQLYGVSALDPATFVCLTLLFSGVGLVACYVPARRAAKVDPIVALRYQ